MQFTLNTYIDYVDIYIHLYIHICIICDYMSRSVANIAYVARGIDVELWAKPVTHKQYCASTHVITYIIIYIHDSAFMNCFVVMYFVYFFNVLCRDGAEVMHYHLPWQSVACTIMK